MSTLRGERHGRLQILRIDKPRGNAIDAALVEDLIRELDAAAADDAVRGVLLASAHPKIFCPGLDLVSLIEYDRSALHGFMLRFAAMVWTLYGLRKPVVAAVNGHAVAGGCILALAADVRVLRRGAQIGLNEVRIGLPLPWSVSILLRASVPPTSLAQVALVGRNFEGEEALAFGLAHELAEADGFEALCLARLQELAEKDAQALGVTKAYLRAGALAEMKSQEHSAIGDFLDAWFADATRERMRSMVANLTRK